MIKFKSKLEKIDKIIHLSDIHVRNFKRHEEFRKVFSRLKSYVKSVVTKETLICITGDIVHAKTDVTPELFQEVQALFKMLSDIAPLLIIPGNHDTNLNNSHRLDAITPIINALNSDNILYVKDTSTFKIGNVNFSHWSVFDKKEKFIKASEIGGEYKVCLYHGPVNGTLTQPGYQFINQNLSVSDFEGFDIVLLGDIHLHQTLQEYSIEELEIEEEELEKYLKDGWELS